MTREEIEAEIHKIKTEGLFPDEDNDGNIMGLVDYYAGQQVIKELEQQLKEIDNPVQSKEVVPVYNSLEEITQDIGKVYTPEADKASEELDRMYVKLQNTISSGAYIKQDGKE